MSPRTVGLADLASLAGQELGTSRWHRIDQDTVDRFAALTNDHQWIHVDPVRAASGPFGTPVAHGFLVLALIPAMVNEAVTVSGVRYTLNKGLDRVRLNTPVRVGDQVRARVTVASARPRPRDHQECVFAVRVEGADPQTPVLRVKLTYLFLPESGAAHVS